MLLERFVIEWSGNGISNTHCLSAENAKSISHQPQQRRSLSSETVLLITLPRRWALGANCKSITYVVAQMTVPDERESNKSNTFSTKRNQKQSILIINASPNFLHFQNWLSLWEIW